MVERERQQRAEGWSAEHDDQHEAGELAAAGAAYALAAADVLDPRSQGDGQFRSEPPSCWPWDRASWKPEQGVKDADRVRELVKAGALIAAEIDRINRAIARDVQDEIVLQTGRASL
jgi:hypothetical protein